MIRRPGQTCQYKISPRSWSRSPTSPSAVTQTDLNTSTRFWDSHIVKSKSLRIGVFCLCIYAPCVSLLRFSPELHAPQTAANLAALLVAPINSYQSVLTLLAIPRYVPLLTQQLFSTRRSIAHSVVSSVLKNETVIETPGDVDGVLDLCHVLIKDQTDPVGGSAVKDVKEIRRQGPYVVEKEDMAEEQGWAARMVHLFRADSLAVQFEVCLAVNYGGRRD